MIKQLDRGWQVGDQYLYDYETSLIFLKLSFDYFDKVPGDNNQKILVEFNPISKAYMLKNQKGEFLTRNQYWSSSYKEAPHFFKDSFEKNKELGANIKTLYERSQKFREKCPVLPKFLEDLADFLNENITLKHSTEFFRKVFHELGHRSPTLLTSNFTFFTIGIHTKYLSFTNTVCSDGSWSSSHLLETLDELDPDWKKGAIFYLPKDPKLQSQIRKFCKKFRIKRMEFPKSSSFVFEYPDTKYLTISEFELKKMNQAILEIKKSPILNESYQVQSNRVNP